MSTPPDDAIHHSSGTFTLDPGRQSRLQGEYGLEEPALAVLRAVQAAVALGAQAIAFRLSKTSLRLQLRLAPGPLAPELPDSLKVCWGKQGEPEEWSQHGNIWTWNWRRQVTRQQLRRELDFLHQRAQFCPIPLKLAGYILQPPDFHYRAPQPSPLIKSGYHLAERYTALSEGQHGVAVFRPDAKQRGPRINSEQTYWRSLDPQVERLQWWMPWRVAGQVARLRSGSGFRAGSVAFLLAHPAQPSFAIAIHQGVEVDRIPLDWDELPGLCLVFDASQHPVDLSGLRLVKTLELHEWLLGQRRQIGSWVAQNLNHWNVENRTHQVTSRQNRKEAAAWLSIWGITVVTGLAMYLPLPLLGLPWIVWHHSSRKSIFNLWRQRLAELGLR